RPPPASGAGRDRSASAQHHRSAARRRPLPQGAIVNGTRTTLEMRCRPPAGTTAGAVPRTTYAVSTAFVLTPKKPGTVICQSLNVWFRPWVFDTAFSWNTPARLVFGPCNGVPGRFGVVESSTTRPGAPGSGPGWKVGLFGSLKNGL